LPGLAQGQSRPAEVASGRESVERILSSHPRGDIDHAFRPLV
jgi:hypothetical protein